MSQRPLRSGVGMKVGTIRGRRDETGADQKAAKSFLRLAVGGIGGEKRVQLGDDPGVVEVFSIELGEACAVKGGAEIKIVAARPFTHEAYLREVGPCAPVR